ncbi:MAG: hypothetical protein IJ325_04970 [Clostridia bacterium]|nr:hypothetical protein [Clostridia bacterium]
MNHNEMLRYLLKVADPIVHTYTEDQLLANLPHFHKERIRRTLPQNDPQSGASGCPSPPRTFRHRPLLDRRRYAVDPEAHLEQRRCTGRLSEAFSYRLPMP